MIDPRAVQIQSCYQHVGSAGRGVMYCGTNL